MPTACLEPSKGGIPASRYGETFAPRCTVLRVKARAHTCQKEACLLPLVHNQHRKTSQQGEQCVEAKRKGKETIINCQFTVNKSIPLKSHMHVFYYSIGLYSWFLQLPLKEKRYNLPQQNID